MKLRVVWIGKTRSRELSALIDDFLERLRRFVSADITEIRDPRTGNDKRQLAAEEERLLAALDSDDRVVVLDAVPPVDVLWINDPQQLADVDAIQRSRLSASPHPQHQPRTEVAS